MQPRNSVIATIAFLGLVASANATEADTPTPTATPVASPGGNPSPTSTPPPPGSISGRVYVDVNANGVFDAPDVGAAFQLEVRRTDGVILDKTTMSSSDGTYVFDELVSADYKIQIIIPIVGCPQGAETDWVGATDFPLCTSPRLTIKDKTISLLPGQHRTGVDFPQLPVSTIVSGRIWVDAEAADPTTTVVFTVGGEPCWTGTVVQSTTAGGVTISTYHGNLSHLGCEPGEIGITVVGHSSPVSESWEAFWRHSLHPKRGPIGGIRDTELPAFFGLWGTVEGGRDGTLVRAVIGDTLCGTARANGSGLFFGLIVTPETLKPGCGSQGRIVEFCVSDAKANNRVMNPDAAAMEVWKAGTVAGVGIQGSNEPCPVFSFPPLGGPSTAGGWPRGPLAVLAFSLILTGAAASIFVGRLVRRP